jgi:hypothetical protein
MFWMNWPRAIWSEFRLAFRLTFIEPFSARPLRLRGHGWQRDPHLRFGFFVGLPFFLIPSALALSNPRQPIFFAMPFLGAIAANIVWFTAAAWRRAKTQSR